MNKELSSLVLSLYTALHPLQFKAQQVPRQITCPVQEVPLPNYGDNNLVAVGGVRDGYQTAVHYYFYNSREKPTSVIIIPPGLLNYFIGSEVYDVVEFIYMDQQHIIDNPSAIIQRRSDVADVRFDFQGPQNLPDGVFESQECYRWSPNLVEHIGGIVLERMINRR